MKNNSTVCKKLFAGSLIAFNLFLFSCKDSPDSSVAPVLGSVYVVNEGTYGSSNGSVSIYDTVTNKAQIDPFKDNNPGLLLGDVVQSLTLIDDKAYIVVNNSNKIEITNAANLKSIATIKNLALPRTLLKVNSQKAYLSEWVTFGTGRISVIELATNTVTKKIDVGVLPGNMLLYGNKVYVANTGSSFLSVINTDTDLVESTITTTSAPNSLVMDNNNKLWVLSGGNKVYNDDFTSIIEEKSDAGALQKIDPATGTIELTLPYFNKTDDPAKLAINNTKDKLYFLSSINGGIVYKYEIGSASISSSPFINRRFYGLGIDPTEGKIYCGIAEFSSNQKMIRYNASGAALDSTEVGIGPNGFVFK